MIPLGKIRRKKIMPAGSVKSLSPIDAERGTMGEKKRSTFSLPLLCSHPVEAGQPLRIGAEIWTPPNGKPDSSRAG